MPKRNLLNTSWPHFDGKWCSLSTSRFHNCHARLHIIIQCSEGCSPSEESIAYSLSSIHFRFKLKLNQDLASCTFILETNCIQLMLFVGNENKFSPHIVMLSFLWKPSFILRGPHWGLCCLIATMQFRTSSETANPFDSFFAHMWRSDR